MDATDTSGGSPEGGVHRHHFVRFDPAQVQWRPIVLVR